MAPQSGPGADHYRQSTPYYVPRHLRSQTVPKWILEMVTMGVHPSFSTKTRPSQFMCLGVDLSSAMEALLPRWVP